MSTTQHDRTEVTDMRTSLLTAALTALLALGVVTSATAQTPPAPKPQVVCGGACDGGGISCSVTANNPHMSSSVPGAASADGQTVCNANVDVIKNRTALYRYYSGAWNAVGDADGVTNTRNNASSVTGTSKENPCHGGSAYVSASYGYALLGSTPILNGTDWNFGNFGNGYVLC